MFNKDKERIKKLEEENERLRKENSDLKLMHYINDGLMNELKNYFYDVHFINGEGWTLKLRDDFYKYKEIDDKAVLDYLANRTK